MTDALRVAESQGVDPDLASDLLSKVVRGMVAGWNDGLKPAGNA